MEYEMGGGNSYVPGYGMDIQPEYGTCPCMAQPRGMNMPQARDDDMWQPRNPDSWQPSNGNTLPPQRMPAAQPAANGEMPYYQMPGYPQALWQEIESDKDMQKLKEMYPDAAKEILPYIEEECDKMEYEGSVMFDEYPDRVMMGKIRNTIYDKVKDKYELPEDGDKDEVLAMNRETRRRYPPRKNWLGDMIDVLLFQEMHRRRCRHRNCRGWR